MSRRDHHVLRRDARPLLNQPSCLDAQAAVQAEQITHHEGELRLAVIEHETARVQFVVYMFGRIRREPADNLQSEWALILLVAAPARSPGPAAGAAQTLPAKRAANTRASILAEMAKTVATNRN